MTTYNTDDYIWAADAHNTTPMAVAERFAAQYWDQPRQVENTETTDMGLEFTVVDGTRTYLVYRYPGERFMTAPSYRVSVIA